jgi:hypothetical protein
MWPLVSLVGWTIRCAGRVLQERSEVPEGAVLEPGLACAPTVSKVDCPRRVRERPDYVGRVRVDGPDVYGLDRDGDGIGCE